ncbi:hypothetical protein PIB30_070273 [Stylosanthes scabra]|uniref:Uncharacterized protein n=1 Tax=Stylosanthes scabra TaxID=79078 RepID=A0ABU6UM54_9FABA|nr:hypothetical protein [Stylosanthes scabra]
MPQGKGRHGMFLVPVPQGYGSGGRRGSAAGWCSGIGGSWGAVHEGCDTDIYSCRTLDARHPSFAALPLRPSLPYPAVLAQKNPVPPPLLRALVFLVGRTVATLVGFGDDVLWLGELKMEEARSGLSFSSSFYSSFCAEELVP